MTLGVTVVSGTSSVGGLPAHLAQKGGAGWLHARVATMTGDTAYPTTGYPITASTFGFAVKIVGVIQLATSGSDYQHVEYDYGSQTLRVYGSSGAVLSGTTPSEVGSGSNISSQTWEVLVLGI